MIANYYVNGGPNAGAYLLYFESESDMLIFKLEFHDQYAILPFETFEEWATINNHYLYYDGYMLSGLPLDDEATLIQNSIDHWARHGSIYR